MKVPMRANDTAFLTPQVLLKNEYARSASHIGLQSTKVIEQVDKSTIVFTGVWQPGGWAAALLAPRDVVIKRTWRCAPTA